MKKMTAFFTIALLVCIATFVAFANINRDVSHCFLTVDNDFPAGYSDEDCTGTDSEGPLYSTASKVLVFSPRQAGNTRSFTRYSAFYVP